MIGILIGLGISWALLFLIEKKSLLALGFLPVGKRLAQFSIGFLLSSILCIGVQFVESSFSFASWKLSENFSLDHTLGLLYWDFKSVFTEELLFRGALLYILIQKIGSQKAMLISAVTFGVYHWFSFGIFGNIVPMIFVFLGTGLMGYAWALAFSKTNSMLLPIGLHLGWNFTLNSIFSKGPLGEGVFINQSGEVISDWASLVGLWLVPVLVFLFVKFVVPKEEAYNRNRVRNI